MEQAQILDIFKRTGALLNGHFALSSGLHSGQYLQCALILQDPKYASSVCSELAKRFEKEKPTLVIGPALGGIIVAFEVGKALGVKSIFAERKEGEMKLRRGFAIAPEDRVLVVEDVVTTGASTKEVIDLVRESGAAVLGVGAIVDRSKGVADFGVRFEALLKMDIENFSPEECPLCKSGIPLTKPGSR